MGQTRQLRQRGQNETEQTLKQEQEDSLIPSTQLLVFISLLSVFYVLHNIHIFIGFANNIRVSNGKAQGNYTTLIMVVNHLAVNGQSEQLLH